MTAAGEGTQAYLRQWYDDIAFWRPLRLRFLRWRQEHPFGLFTASTLVIVVLAAFAVGLWLVLGFLLGDNWPWELATTETSRFSVTRMVLFVLAGAVGVIGVVVAYRRQHDVEQGRFLERLAEASRLLGDPNPTVQSAGIYALAGLADTEGRARRQQCVDVLCAYIRLPYIPAPEDHQPEALESVKRTRTLRTQTGPVEEERTLFRPHDRHTRETVISVIAQHLREDAKVKWSDLDLDFTGAVLDYGDFAGAVFTGRVSFKNARFAGGTVDFGGAEFRGGTVDFGGVQVSGGTVNFWRTEFHGGTVEFKDIQVSGGTVNFWRAEFHGGTVDFGGAGFSGGTVRFGGAEFRGGTVEFRGTEFRGGAVSFRRAGFSGGTVNFEGAQFRSGAVSFRGAGFSGGTVNFGGAGFSGGIVNFGGAKFGSGAVSFRGAGFRGGAVDFGGAQFRGGAVSFGGAQFRGGIVNFGGAKFGSGAVSFRGAEFLGGAVKFQSPVDWTTPPVVPWSNGNEPLAGVEPRKWPP
jgi:uncharacterized protein YjbI with pentapeptide repeats